jgi:hypothetical protein
MIRDPALQGERNARVWIDELPHAMYEPVSIDEFVLPASSATWPAREVAVEYLAHTGARLLQGLLGCRFTPDRSDSLKVRVATGASDENSWTPIFVLRKDRYRVGLPQEYGRAVLERLRATESLTRLGPGTLIIGCAGHSDIGSSQSLFGRLTGMMIGVLLLPDADPSDEQLAAVFAGERT